MVRGLVYDSASLGRGYQRACRRSPRRPLPTRDEFRQMPAADQRPVKAAARSAPARIDATSSSIGLYCSQRRPPTVEGSRRHLVLSEVGDHDSCGPQPAQRVARGSSQTHPSRIPAGGIAVVLANAALAWRGHKVRHGAATRGLPTGKADHSRGRRSLCGTADESGAPASVDRRTPDGIVADQPGGRLHRSGVARRTKIKSKMRSSRAYYTASDTCTSWRERSANRPPSARTCWVMT